MTKDKQRVPTPKARALSSRLTIEETHTFILRRPFAVFLSMSSLYLYQSQRIHFIRTPQTPSPYTVTRTSIHLSEASHPRQSHQTLYLTYPVRAVSRGPTTKAEG